MIPQDDGGSVYMSLGAEGMHVGGGAYHPERPKLAAGLREAIADDRSGAELQRIAATCGRRRPTSPPTSVPEDRARRLPADHARIDLLRMAGIIGIGRPVRGPGSRHRKPRPRRRRSAPARAPQRLARENLRDTHGARGRTAWSSDMAASAAGSTPPVAGKIRATGVGIMSRRRAPRPGDSAGGALPAGGARKIGLAIVAVRPVRLAARSARGVDPPERAQGAGFRRLR